MGILLKLRKYPGTLVMDEMPEMDYAALMAKIDKERTASPRSLNITKGADKAISLSGIFPAEEGPVRFVFGRIHELFGLDPGPSGHTAMEAKDLLNPDYLLANGFKLCQPGDGPRMLSKLKVGANFKTHRIVMSPIESSEGKHGIYEIGSVTLGLCLGFSDRDLGEISCLHSDEYVVLREA